MKLQHIGSTAVCVIAALVAAPVLAAAGKFQFVTGDVRLLDRSGTSKPAVKGLAVEEGDTIASGQPAMAQVRMNDGGILVIRPNTRLVIKAFQFSGKEDGSERAHFSLEKGGVRAVTGEIGRTNKQNYLIQTPSASIGVRGTDHEPFTVEAADAALVPAGTYDKVNVGATVVENAKGVVIVQPGEVGYAADAATKPVILPELPALYSGAGDGVKVAKRGSQSSGRARGSSSSGQGAGDSAATVAQPLRTADGLNLSALPPAPEPPPPPPPPLVVDNGIRTPAIVSYVTVGEHGSLVARVDGLRSFTMTSAARLDTPDGVQPFQITWGRWADGFTLPNTEFTGGLHFANSSEMTTGAQLQQIQLSRQAEYQLLGGPRPTNELGATGALDRLSVSVDFATQRVTNYAVELTMPATVSGAANSQWQASGGGSIAAFMRQGIELDVNCVNCRSPGQTAAGTGSAKGAFVGPNAEALLSAFGLKVDGHTVSGVAASQR